jgi:hypothetical protein
VHVIGRAWRGLPLPRKLAAEWGLLSRLRARRYDLLVTLTEHPRGVSLARLLRPRYRVAPDQPGRGRFWRKSFTHLYRLPGNGRRHTVEVNLDAPVRLWRNVGDGTAADPGAMGSWLGIRLRQPGPNRDAIGSILEVRVGDLTLRRELTIGGGHTGGQLGPAHFGLGSATDASVRVTWPDGEVGPWLPVTAGQELVVERGAGEAVPWQPAGD